MRFISALLSESPEVEEWMLKYVTVYMIYVIVDCVQVTISGNLRGMGKQVLRCINLESTEIRSYK